MRRLGPTVLVVLLLAATATSFAVTEHLKLEESPVRGTRFPDLFSPRKVELRIGFRLLREEDIRLDILDSRGTPVREGVGSGFFRPGFHQFAWDGRDDGGRIVPDGLYRVALRLLDEDRTFEFPHEVRVDSSAPTIDVEIRHGVFSPDGDGRADRVDLRYRFSEPAFAILYLNGKRIARSHGSRPVNTMQWYGRGKKPGEYRLALAAQDRAGNIAGSTRAFTVRLRYVALYRHRFRPRGSRLRVRVSADAKTVRWRLGGQAGVGRPPRLTIPVPSRAGRYELVVSVGAHRDRATVVVGRRHR
jgi:hypothetical protein